jgi:hypothetical protein
MCDVENIMIYYSSSEMGRLLCFLRFVGEKG